MGVYLIPVAVWAVASVPFCLAIGKLIELGKRDRVAVEYEGRGSYNAQKRNRIIV